MTRSTFSGLRSFDNRLLGRCLRYGVPLVPVTLAFWVFNAADRIIVGLTLGELSLGLYAVASTVAVIASVFLIGLSQAWVPRAMDMAQSTPDRARAVLGRALTYVLGGLVVLQAVLTAAGPEILRLLAGSAYDKAFVLVGPILLGVVALGTNSFTATGLTVSGRTPWLTYASLMAAIVNVVAVAVLAMAAGTLGAAWGTAVGYWVLTVSFLVLSQRAWPVRLQTWRLLGLSALAVAIATVWVVSEGQLPIGWRVLLALSGGVSAQAIVLVGNRQLRHRSAPTAR